MNGVATIEADPQVARHKPLAQLVAEHAAATPGKPFLQEVDGPGYTYGEAHERALRLAGGLRAFGVQRGDHVATMLDNCADGPLMWLALSHIGAVEVPISTHYRGRLLAHALILSGARLLFADAAALDALATAAEELTCLEQVIVRDDAPLPSGMSLALRSSEDLLAAGEPIAPGEPPRPWDIATVVFTSGTTGLSKGALLPWRAIAFGATVLTGELGPDDVIYHTSPANHLIARVHLLSAATVGAAIVLKPAFRTQDFWADIDRYGCTYTVLVGAMAHFIMSQPEDPADADHPLDKVSLSPIHPQLERLQERFAITRVSSAFGMTECPSPVRTGWNGIENAASCGRVATGWPGIQLRLVDAHDEEVPVGEVGELIVRSDVPWTMAVGYLGMPEATARAWRNGWFHTGDAFRQDADGRFYFVDRMKDAIRRRGENVSSFEIEMEVNAHPAVAESAAIGVSAGDSEEEIKVFVVAAPDAELDPAELIGWLVPRMTRYMIPRYVEVVDALPKTPTLRVKKHELRERPAGPTFDRVEAGIEIPRR